MSRKKLVALVGPTASGKSELSLRMADALDGEIVSADSVQVYRGMDIGTAKPSLQERAQVRHHMIDIADPLETYSVGRFQQEAREAVASIHSRGKLPLLVGGSGLYVNALTHELHFAERPEADPVLRQKLQTLSAEELYKRLVEADPAAAARIHPNNTVRLIRAIEIAVNGTQAEYNFAADSCEYIVAILGISRPREELYNRINARVDRMLRDGLVAEVDGLLTRYGADAHAMQAIGYKEIAAYLEGRIASLQEAAELIKRNTRHFAKRQLTWFRRDRRIVWVSPDSGSLQDILAHMEFSA